VQRDAVVQVRRVRVLFGERLPIGEPVGHTLSSWRLDYKRERA
jgi:hypothetical protein